MSVILKRIKKYRFEILCILPLVVFLLVSTLVPIVRTVVLSFHRHN